MAPAIVQALLLMHRLYIVEKIELKFVPYTPSIVYGSAVWSSCVQSPVKVRFSLSEACHTILPRTLNTPVPP